MLPARLIRMQFVTANEQRLLAENEPTQRQRLRITVESAGICLIPGDLLWALRA